MASETATVPVAFFQGKPLEEGTRCEVEIVAVGEDGVQVRYVPHEGEEENSQFNGMVDETVAAQDEAGAY